MAETYRSGDAELDALYAAITGRKPFSYNASADPMYRAYADRYVQNGRLAMMDTMGQAAALTGGYGSSYAQAVGQQQYDEYLRALSEAMPELYGLAWQRYQAEGDALQNAYDLAAQREREAYEREREAQEAARRQADTDYARRQDSYKQLYQLISATGYVPGAAELNAAGMSRERAEALRNAWLAKNRPSGSGTRTVYIRSSNSGSSGKSSGTVVKPSQQHTPSQPVTPPVGGGGGRWLAATR